MPVRRALRNRRQGTRRTFGSRSQMRPAAAAFTKAAALSTSGTDAFIAVGCHIDAGPGEHGGGALAEADLFQVTTGIAQ